MIYDAYRPQRAVNDFLRWSKEPLSDLKSKQYFFPYLSKEEIITQGFIAGGQSTHSRGSAVDLSIIPIGAKQSPLTYLKRFFTDGKEYTFLDDGTLDMGVSFDYFGEASYTISSLISSEALNNRLFLKEIMESVGDFENYAKEWWHFTLRDEPFPKTYFDFIVK